MTNGTAALSIRRVAIDTFREHVAYLHRDCTAVRAEGFQALSKVEVSGNGAAILAVLNPFFRVVGIQSKDYLAGCDGFQERVADIGILICQKHCIHHHQ